MKRLLPILGALCLSGFALAGDPPAPEPYLRVQRGESPRTLALEMAVRRFRPAHGSGPTIWLAGASHVGDPAYYQALQELLDAQGRVLYEGVRPTRDETLPPDGMTGPEPGSEHVQAQLAQALGLVFQLDAVDYTRPHFRNRDLSLEELREALGKDNRKARGMLDLLEGSSTELEQILKGVLANLGGNPKAQALVKVLLMELLGSTGGDPRRVAADDPALKEFLDLLLTGRNQVVVAALRQALAEDPAPDSLALFYGAAHMPDLERAVTRELGYVADETRWLRAFGTDLDRVGLSAAELRLARMLFPVQQTPPEAPVPEPENALKP